MRKPLEFRTLPQKSTEPKVIIVNGYINLYEVLLILKEVAHRKIVILILLKKRHVWKDC